VALGMTTSVLVAGCIRGRHRVSLDNVEFDMALLANGAWVVVLDGEKAMILENTGTPSAPKLRLHEKMEQELEANREIGSDRPGRMPDRPGLADRSQGPMSAMEQTDYHRLAKERFVATIAARVNKLAAKGSLGPLVIAAPPQSLAVLRDHLSPAVIGTLIAELPKTLTQHPLDKIGQMIAGDIDAL